MGRLTVPLWRQSHCSGTTTISPQAAKWTLGVERCRIDQGLSRWTVCSERQERASTCCCSSFTTRVRACREISGTPCVPRSWYRRSVFMSKRHIPKACVPICFYFQRNNRASMVVKYLYGHHSRFKSGARSHGNFICVRDTLHFTRIANSVARLNTERKAS